MSNLDSVALRRRGLVATAASAERQVLAREAENVGCAGETISTLCEVFRIF
jgi:hypothetical protein